RYSPVAVTARYLRVVHSAAPGRLASGTGAIARATSYCARSVSFASMRFFCQLPAVMQIATAAIAAKVGNRRGRNLPASAAESGSVSIVRARFRIDGDVLGLLHFP